MLSSEIGRTSPIGEAPDNPRRFLIELCPIVGLTLECEVDAAADHFCK